MTVGPLAQGDGVKISDQLDQKPKIQVRAGTRVAFLVQDDVKPLRARSCRKAMALESGRHPRFTDPET